MEPLAIGRTLRHADRLESAMLGPARVCSIRMPLDDVVTWRGSFRTWPDFGAGEEILQELTVNMLEKGTARRDRFEVSEFLDDRGASLEIRSDGLRIDVAGKALKKDVSDVLGLMAELLLEPRFTEEEFLKARSQLAGSLRRSMDSTAHRASVALSQLLYPEGHPNFNASAETELEQLTRLELEDLVRYHRQKFVPDDFTLVFSGDVRLEHVSEAVQSNFEGWKSRSRNIDAVQAPLDRAERLIRVPMRDRDNLDVRLGHSLPLRRDDPDYVAFFVANYVLGGNFSARLMTRIRDEQGLTYGIRSSLVGVETEYDGHWQIGVTLSSDNLQAGIDAVNAEIRRFVEQGITREELDEKKRTIVGSFEVGLATTAGMASTILLSVERGLGLDYVDRFPREVTQLSANDVNDAIRLYTDADRLSTAVAGTF